jgi:hypothetical protein
VSPVQTETDTEIAGKTETTTETLPRPSNTTESLAGTSESSPAQQTPTPQLNETKYPVGLPYQTFGVSSTTSPLLGEGSKPAASVHPIRSEDEWQTIRTSGSEQPAELFEGYEFVTETDFDSETIIIVQRSYITGVMLQLESVSGVGTNEVLIRAKRIGESPVNTRHYRYLFIRLPTDGDEIEQITVKLEEFGEVVTLEYDGSGTPTPLPAGEE